MEWHTHPLFVYAVATAGAVGAWLKFRLGRWDQQALRISELEKQVAQLQHELRDAVDLKVSNALLQAEVARLERENDSLKAAVHRRRHTDPPVA